ncbi:MAG: helix-turn-helix domain-containing protein [Acidobacteria bacterium]|nr:helix-turn-helix domain-containing protein [Acidobacteriota bacterium]
MAVNTDHLDDAIQRMKKRVTKWTKDLDEHLQQELDALQGAVDELDRTSARRNQRRHRTGRAATGALRVFRVEYKEADDRGGVPVIFDEWPPVRLSRQECTLLRILEEDAADGFDDRDDLVPYKSREQVVARMRGQWNDTFLPSALNAAVCRLRRKLRKVPSGEELVQTRPGYGYRLRKIRAELRGS